MRLAAVYGIPLEARPSCLLAGALIAWSVGAGLLPQAQPGVPSALRWALAVSCAALLLASVVLHELAHCVAAHARGLRTRSITLFVFGGQARLEHEPADPASELLVALAGPGASVLLAALFLQGLRLPGLAPAAAYLGLANLVLALFNLLPGLPLDGGRALRALLWPWLGRARATLASATAGVALAAGLLGLGVVFALAGLAAGLWWMLLAGVLFARARAARDQARLEAALEHLRVRDSLRAPEEVLGGETRLLEALADHRLLSPHDVHLVSSGRAVTGLVAVSDAWGLPREERRQATAARCAHPLREVAIGPDEPLSLAFRRMVEAGSDGLVVVKDSELLGLVTLEGVLESLRASSKAA